MSDDPFVTHRSLLFTVAYEMLGSAADAEDVVQETWLRWADVDRAEVREPRAYLVRIVTRLALNRLRTLARRREEYVGEWLPEPLLTSPDVAEDVEFAESVSIAMLTVLETLAPVERAVFVLRDVFDLPYAEIAAAVDKTPAAVRQIAHRARSTSPRGGRGFRSIVPRSSRWSSGSWRRCGPGISRCCSTCSHPTSCWSPTVAARWPLSGVRWWSATGWRPSSCASRRSCRMRCSALSG
jgi:RNA polymerase sigma factor (sigma-70 family)